MPRFPPEEGRGLFVKRVKHPPMMEPRGLVAAKARLIARCTDPRPLAGVRGGPRPAGKPVQRVQAARHHHPQCPRWRPGRLGRDRGPHPQDHNDAQPAPRATSKLCVQQYEYRERANSPRDGAEADRKIEADSGYVTGEPFQSTPRVRGLRRRQVRVKGSRLRHAPAHPCIRHTV